MTLFEDFRNVGVCVLVATHDIALISSMGERVLTLDHGRLSEADALVTL
jgi:cell division transport system ATP-binding protein